MIEVISDAVMQLLRRLMYDNNARAMQIATPQDPRDMPAMAPVSRRNRVLAGDEVELDAIEAIDITPCFNNN